MEESLPSWIDGPQDGARRLGPAAAGKEGFGGGTCGPREREGEKQEW